MASGALLTVGQSSNRKPKWALFVMLTAVSLLVLPAQGDGQFRPLIGKAKPHVADADAALTADQSAQESVKEMTLEKIMRVFEELPRFASYSDDQLPREDDRNFQEALLRTKSDSLSGRISVSDISTAMVEQSIPGDSGEEFLEELFELFKAHFPKLLSQTGGSEEVVVQSGRAGGGRKLLQKKAVSSGSGTTLTGSSTKRHVALEDAALTAAQEATVDMIALAFEKLPHELLAAFMDVPVPQGSEDDRIFQEALLRTQDDFFNGLIPFSVGESGEQFMDKLLKRFDINMHLLSRTRGSKDVVVQSGRPGRGRKLLQEKVVSSGTGTTLTATSTPTSTSSPTSSSSSGSKKWGPLTEGAWIGIIIAIIFAVGAFTILCWCLECVCCCCCF